MSVEFPLKASVDEVFAWICDPDFLVQRGLDLGELEMSCEVTEDDDGVHISSTRLSEVELPAFLRSIFDTQQQVEMEEHWTGDSKRMEGDVTILMPGQPVQINATRVIEATGKNSCVWRVSHRAKVNLPLIGGKAAGFVEKTVDDKALEELEYLAESLAESD